jgi:putative ABC transport system permease protein
MRERYSVMVEHGGEYTAIDEALFTDAGFFEIFSFPLLRGDPAKVLEPNTLVLTASLAQKLFGDDDAIGKVLSMEVGEKEEAFAVTGIAKDPPENSHFTFEMLVPFRTLYRTRIAINNNQFLTYLLLREGHSAKELENKLPAFAEAYHGKEYVEKRSFRYELQPLFNIYFGEEDAPNKGDLRYIAIFSAIALLILLIACANFMNLAIARSFQRSREVGVRKVLGARRSQLVRQFLGESVLFCLLAIPFAIGIIELALPTMSAMTGKTLILDLGSNAAFLLFLGGIVLFVGLVAGSYPAIFLSAFQPEAALKGRQPLHLRGAFLRKALIVCQFFISIALIAGTAVMQKQLHFIQNKKLGFDKEQVVVLPLANTHTRERKASLKNELLEHPAIVSVSTCAGAPTDRAFAGMRYLQLPIEGVEARVDMHIASVDEDFVQTLGMKIVAGRDFSEAFSTDESEAFLINETAAKAFGFVEPDEIIGKRLNMLIKVGTVIGVVKDFHGESLHKKIEPFLLHIDRRYHWAIAIRIQPNAVNDALAYIQKQWRAFAPGMPFEMSFLDEKIDALYRKEQRIRRIFLYFSGLAVFLACLGLFGLAAFAAERRTKEIGIRKVLGATVANVTALLSKDFVKLVLLANVIAWLVAWYAMNRWLQNFAYRIEIEWWIFLLAGGLALVIALLTVSTQAIRAALANPVESLRYE